MLSGSVVGGTVSFIIAIIGMKVHPEQYDFESTRAIGQCKTLDGDGVDSPPLQPEIDGDSSDTKVDEPTKQAPEYSAVEKRSQMDVEPCRPSLSGPEEETDESFLQRAFVRSVWVSLILCTILVIIIPLPLFFSSVVYSQKGFATWISLVIVWLLVAACGCILYPIWESYGALVEITSGIYKDWRRKPSL
jgi:hypothetical protein